MTTPKPKPGPTDKQFESLRDRQAQVRSRPLDERDGNQYGTVVWVKPRFIIMRKADDFREDGFLIIPRKRIARIECDPDMAFFQSVMKREGTLASIELPGWLKKPSLPAMLKSISRERRVIGFEVEKATGHSYYVGVVEESTSTGFGYQYVNPSGSWQSERYFVPWSALICIHCMDNYSEMFAKHAPPPDSSIDRERRGIR